MVVSKRYYTALNLAVACGSRMLDLQFKSPTRKGTIFVQSVAHEKDVFKHSMVKKVPISCQPAKQKKNYNSDIFRVVVIHSLGCRDNQVSKSTTRCNGVLTGYKTSALSDVIEQA